MRNNCLHTPDGIRDYLPDELAAKKEIQDRLENTFECFGYLRVDSPTLEFVEVFEQHCGVPTNMYKLIDRDGAILALRPDITPAIGRIAATMHVPGDFPLRFRYMGNVFRYNKNYQGKEKEFIQAGVELIGESGTDADAEIVALAAKSLLAAGLNNFRINIGHAGFLRGVLEESGISEPQGTRLRQFVLKGEFTAVEEMLNECPMPERSREFLRKLPLWIGGREVLDNARGYTSSERAQSALSDLGGITGMLADYGLADVVSVDLSLLGHLDYYTGMVMSGYTHGAGFPILDGGRYDQLLSRFGMNAPAVGFAVNVNALMEALGKSRISTDRRVKILVSYTEQGRAAAIMAAESLRSQGFCVETGLSRESLAKCVEYADKKRIDKVLYFSDNANPELVNVKTGETKTAELPSDIKRFDGGNLL